MKRFRLIAVLALLFCMVVHAGGAFRQIWNYQELFDQSDVVLILSVTEKTTASGKTFLLSNDNQTYDIVSTKFKKHAVFKGEFEEATWQLNHYWYPKERTLIVAGPGFTTFNDVGKMFMVFLKANEDGKLDPVSGQLQVRSSFVEMPLDGLTMIERAPWVQEISKDSE